MKTKTLLTVTIVLIVISTITVIAAFQTQQSKGVPTNQQDEETLKEQFPIADFNAKEPSDPVKKAKRKDKSKKYDKPISALTNTTTNKVTHLDWEVGLSALPVTKSDAVVIGEVAEAQAFLSEDKTEAYSEFTLRVDEVLKNDQRTPISQGSSIIIERAGGRVRFPSGHIALSFVSGQGMPRVGRRYALFLTHNFSIFGGIQEQDFYILTGYELHSGKVIPLDNPGDHPLATAYKGADESAFISDLRSAIANPHP